MKRVAVLMLVSLTGLTFSACEKPGDTTVAPPAPTQDVGPITTDLNKANVNSAAINGLGASHLNAGDPNILLDQKTIYTKHELPAAPVTAAASATAPATAPADATAPATTEPAK